MTTTDTRTVYVGSLWHRDCDPFATVIGYDGSEVEIKLRELADEEFKRCIDNEWTSKDEDDIVTGAVNAKTVPEGRRLSDKVQGKLETDGITAI